MSWIKDTFFGGAQQDAAEQQARSIDEAAQIQRQATQQARDRILGMFPDAYQSLTSGYEGAAEQIAEGATSSKDVLRQSYANSGQILSQGTNQVIGALLGRPSGTQPQQPQQQQLQPPKSTPQPVQRSGLRPYEKQIGGVVQDPNAPVMQPGAQPAKDRANTGDIRERIDFDRQYSGGPVRNPNAPTMQASSFGANLPSGTANAVSGLQMGGGSVMENTPFDMRQLNMTGGIIGAPNVRNREGLGGNDLTQSPESGSPFVDQMNIPVERMNTQTNAPQQIPQGDYSGIGLSGAEGALQSGLRAQLGSYQQGMQSGLSSLGQGLQNQLGAYQNALSGSESAITGAANQQQQALQQAGQQQAGAVTDAAAAQQQALQQAAQQQAGVLSNAASAQQGALQQGIGQQAGAISGATDQQQQAVNQAAGQQLGSIEQSADAQRQAIQQGVNQQAGSIQQGYQQGIGSMNPYAETGQQAMQREAALSGSLGVDAQQQAIDSFMESPGQKYLREQAEKSLLRNASKTGGLRGGSTLAALQEQAIGLSSQQQQQQLENMRSLAGRGQQAAGNIAGMQVGQGQDLSNVYGSGAQNIANITGAEGQQRTGVYGQQGQQLSNIAGQEGQQLASVYGSGSRDLANVYGQEGQQLANVFGNQGEGLANVAGQQGQQLSNIFGQQGQSLSNVFGQQGQQLSGLRSQFGQLGGQAIGDTAQQGAQMQYQTGQLGGQALSDVGSQLGQYRMGAGQQVAGQLQGLTSNLANQQTQLGESLAGIDQQTSANLANIMQSGGEQGFGAQMQLAQILANLATGQGSNLANLTTQRGQALAAGTTGSANAAAETVGTIGGTLAGYFSDSRLKENVEPLTRVNGVNWYTADYKDMAPVPEEMRGQRIVCVMADELKQTHPQLVGERDGYLTVDYEAMKRVH